MDAGLGKRKTTLLGDCATLIKDTVSPSGLGDLPYVGLEHIGENTLSLVGHGSADEVISPKTRFKKGDILFGKLRPYFRKVIRAPFDGICSTDIWVIRPKNGIEPEYLFYCMASQSLINFASSASEGTRMPRAKWDYVSQYKLPIRPRSERRSIARILGALDEKIELNRRMNETLEEMARALFKSWFVDFDPVRAKMENRDTGLPKHIADLFPDRLVGSELGQIPEEWSIGHAGDIFKQLHEKENPLSYPRRKFQYFSIPAFDKRRWPKTEFGENIKSQKSKVPLGAVLLSKLNPDIERVWAVDVAERDQAICSTEFLVLFPRPAFGRAFVYSLVCSSFFQHKVQTLVTGTSKSHQRAHAKAILDLSVVLPPVSLSRLFEEVGEMLLCRTFQCHRESELLSTLRDALLLKLISGELKVNDRRVRGLH